MLCYIYDTMTTSDLIEIVKRQAQAIHVEQYRSRLELIPASFRQRFFFTLEYSCDICFSLSLLYKGRKLPDRNYYRYADYMIKRSLKNIPEQILLMKN